MLSIRDLGDGITCIDTGYMRANLAACYLLQSGDRAAFIETGVNKTVPGLLELLDQKGIPRENVDYVIPTHVHLDHAGGAGALMQKLPNAQLVIHPRGARHLVDPSKLIAGTSAVYGNDKFKELYGELIPVDTERVIEANDDFVLDFNGRELVFPDTPGHARHHFCVVDTQSRSIFTGDTFGLSYREFDYNERIFCFPTTTPVQFDADALHDSIDRLLGYKPVQMLLTHFCAINQPEECADQLHSDINSFVGFLKEYGPDQLALTKRMTEHLLQRARMINPEIQQDFAKSLLAHDIELNVQGLIISHKD
ncbi:MAG: MBL fold metallo-hydrolase [Gammaproteobacteria bacterium]|nr:MAG: MBL fold metallo-hydrolase [Gammaproteobacteria bacterium]